MKSKFLLILFVFSAFLLRGQEIKLNSPIVATAGSTSELNPVNISKWRLGEVHLIVLDKEKPKLEIESIWSVSSYPNPFTHLLNLDFKTKEKTDFIIKVNDVLGKKQYYKLEQTILPNQVISIDMEFLSPGMYLVSIIPKDKSTMRVIKVQKQ